MAEQSRTTKRTGGPVRGTGSVVSSTASPVATGDPVAPTTTTPQRDAGTAPAAPARPQPSARLGVRVNVATLENAFLAATPSRSVAYVQYALRERGFDPGSTSGVVDYATRAAYANYQRSLNERPTGIPTDGSLDHLGFDVVG